MLYQPKRLAIRGGYHGCHMTIEVFQKSRPDLKLIDLDDEYNAGDMVWFETPVNPSGESRFVSGLHRRVSLSIMRLQEHQILR